MTLDYLAALPSFTVLLFAHVLGDFSLQTKAMATGKRRLGPLLQHTSIHLALMLAFLGTLTSPVPYVIAGLHLATDAIKARVGDSLRPFLLDQATHIAVLYAAALYAPTLWADGLWAPYLPAPALKIMLLTSGFIMAVWAGGYAVAKLLAPHTRYWNRTQIVSGGLSNAGQVIGQLERALAFGLILINLPGSVALLIAAKSVLRFSDSQSQRRLAEYVIIGTLASVGWAFAVAYAVKSLLPLLPS